MKKIIIPAVIFTLILISAIWFISKSGKTEEISQITPTPNQVLPTITDDIKVELQAINSNRSIVLTISGIPENVETIEYELTYLTGSGLPRGVLGKITVSGESSIKRDDIVLGTCSSGRCVYDTGVESIDLSLKFNAKDKVSVFRKSFPL